MVSRRLGQQDSEACDDSGKPGVAAEKQESDPKTDSKALLLPESSNSTFSRASTHCHCLHPLFKPFLLHFRIQGSWEVVGSHQTIRISCGAYRGYRQRGEVWTAEPCTWRERGSSFIPALSPKLHSQLWITIHPELNPQLRAHRERQKMQFNVYLSI